MFVELEVDPSYLLSFIDVPHPQRAVVRTSHIFIVLKKRKAPDLIGDVIWGKMAVHVVSP